MHKANKIENPVSVGQLALVARAIGKDVPHEGPFAAIVTEVIDDKHVSVTVFYPGSAPSRHLENVPFQIEGERPPESGEFVFLPPATPPPPSSR